MKVRNPISRNHLKIPKKAVVLDVGGGHNPHPRANVVVDKYKDDNSHRTGDMKVLNNQQFINADGQNLPFEDKSFDYVICCHVMEHVPDPARFMDELSRVGKKGYFEVPSLMGEFLAPKPSHTWVSLEIDNKIVCVPKSEIGMGSLSHDFGDFFLYHFPAHSLAYKLLLNTHSNLFTVRHEWNNNIEYIVNPEDEQLRSYFTKAWDVDKMLKQFPKRSIPAEFAATIRAFFDVMSVYFSPKKLFG